MQTVLNMETVPTMVTVLTMEMVPTMETVPTMEMVPTMETLFPMDIFVVTTEIIFFLLNKKVFEISIHEIKIM